MSFIPHEIKHIFTVKPTFTNYTELDEIYRKVIKASIPDEERWENIFEYQEQRKSHLAITALIFSITTFSFSNVVLKRW